VAFRVAINGYGRIGRCVLRALLENSATSNIEIVAINELGDANTIVHLTKYDSTHGRLPYPVNYQDGHLLVGDQKIALLHQKSITDLPWGELDIDLVMECTGRFSDCATAELHISQGAKKVLFSQPADPDVDATVVYGLNQDVLKQDMRIVSNASCTTNALLPVIHAVNAKLGILRGCITTVHSSMNDQPVIDAYHHTDLRKTRAASQSIIPVDTELARGIARIMPNFDGKFEAQAIRVPTTNVSLLDLALDVERTTTAEEVNQLLKEATASYCGVLAFTDEPLASCDFIHDTHSAIVDAGQTRVADGKLIKLIVWFDNEWGFANRMIQTANYWLTRS
jgi:D-erythrose 4-phosphate dehydrogenase